MTKFGFKIAAAALVVGVASMSMPDIAYASGGRGGGGGGGFGGGSIGGVSGQRATRDPLRAAYSRGKRRFKKQVTCRNCEYADGIDDSATARQVALRVQAGEFGIEESDRNDVLVYLIRRYRLQG
ncbi:MAG: hypothetical protein ABJP48_07155 [Erythrobacter sp.]